MLPRRPVSSRTKVRSPPASGRFSKTYCCGTLPHTCLGQWNPALGPILMAHVTGPAANLWKFIQPPQRTGPTRPLKHVLPVGGLTAQPECTRSRGLSWSQPLCSQMLWETWDLVRECAPGCTGRPTSFSVLGSTQEPCPSHLSRQGLALQPSPGHLPGGSDSLPPTTQLCSPPASRPLPLQIILYD